jgi:hypothetical protein
VFKHIIHCSGRCATPIFQEPELFPKAVWTLLCTSLSCPAKASETTRGTELDSSLTPIHFADLSLTMVLDELAVHPELNDRTGMEHEIDASPP